MRAREFALKEREQANNEAELQLKRRGTRSVEMAKSSRSSNLCCGFGCFRQCRRDSIESRCRAKVGNH